MLVHATHCQSGVSSTNYGELCKVTDVSAPVLSIVTNVSVMVLVLLKGWYGLRYLTCGYSIK